MTTRIPQTFNTRFEEGPAPSVSTPSARDRHDEHTDTSRLFNECVCDVNLAIARMSRTSARLSNHGSSGHGSSNSGPQDREVSSFRTSSYETGTNTQNSHASGTYEPRYHDDNDYARGNRDFDRHETGPARIYIPSRHGFGRYRIQRSGNRYRKSGHSNHGPSRQETSGSNSNNYAPRKVILMQPQGYTTSDLEGATIGERRPRQKPTHRGASEYTEMTLRSPYAGEPLPSLKDMFPWDIEAPRDHQLDSYPGSGYPSLLNSPFRPDTPSDIYD
ncbi:hypothetical protein GGR53DRAFT_499838 [Hypoxylon sp. FL1150]|nr:hypothetical protein GGR53DRAFT_499838 [Hypoxylon sp. FL1150]